MPVTLSLPTVLVTTGSTYATMVNTALSTLAAATHTGGANGDKWTAASLNIDGDVSWGGYSITSLKAATFSGQASVATARSLWFETGAAGELWATTGAGTQIQITSGGGLNTAALISAIWTQLAVSTNYTVGASDAYTHFRVDTSAARAFTLPSATTVGAGRFYVISDVTGTAATNNITINRAGSDTFDGGATSHVIDRNYGFAIVVSNGSNAWSVVSPRNASTTVHGLTLLAQDLGGTGTAPTVVAITGDGTKVPLRAGCDSIEFAATASTPSITIADGASLGTSLSIIGQAAGGSNQAGGPINITGGVPTGTGTPGIVNIGSSVSNQLYVGAFSSSRRYVAVATSAPATTDIPTGDGVIYIANANTNPSSNPVGGGVLYVSAGALVYRGTGGTVTTLALA